MPVNYTKKNGKRSDGEQRFIPDPKKYLYNIDTFWFNCRSYYYQEVMDTGLRDKLVAGRHAVMDEGFENDVIELKIPNYENPIKFKVMGGNPPAYSYSIRNDSMAIYFRKNEVEEGSLMRVQINQFILWEKGFERAYNESLQVLKALGFVPYDTKFNRIDFAVHSDQFKWTLEDLKTLSYPTNFAKDNYPGFHRLNPLTGNFETMYHGDRTRLYLRIYDKSKEILAKQKFYFNEIYEKMNMDKENVWNFEIEVRRPYLRDLSEYDEGTDDFLRLFDNVEYCIQNDGISRLWTHLIKKYHHDSAHFKVLAAGDPYKFQMVNDYNIEIMKDVDANYQREVNQILGRLMLGVMDKEDYSLDSAIEFFKETYLGRAEEGEDMDEIFKQKVEDKKAAIQNEAINRTILKEARKAEAYLKKLSKDIHDDRNDLNMHQRIMKNYKKYGESLKEKSADRQSAPEETL